MKNSNNTEVFYQQLKSLWVIESMLVQAMPQMIVAANNLGLKKSLALHFSETTQHKAAIEVICKQLDVTIGLQDKDPGLKEILQNAKELQAEAHGPLEIDAAIISAALEIEEYEQSVYPPAAEAALQSGYEGVAKRLFLTFEEERQADTKLRFLQTQLLGERSGIGQLAEGR